MNLRWAAATVVPLWLPMKAQVEGVPRDVIEQRIEVAAEQLGDESDIDLTNLFEVLSDHYRDPLDLNNTKAEELGNLILLNDAQIGSLLQHIEHNGKLLSLYELQTINGWDANTIALVRPFVTVRENPKASTASFAEILKNGGHELIIRSTFNVEERKGFMDRNNIFGKDYYDPDGEPLPDFENDSVRNEMRKNSQLYLGSPFRVYTRYRFRYRQNISFGITAEKDEGEEFFQGSQPNGYDFYSAHLFIRDIGRLKAVAIGDYAAQFGQGLTFWNGLAFSSKGSYTMSVKRNGIGLAPYASVNENLFMRGAAATFALTRHLDITGFYSQKKLDANATTIDYGTDSLGNSLGEEVIFSSLQEGGYHRTTNEVADKNAIDERIVGGNVRYAQRNLSIGLTAAHIEFSEPLQRDLETYNQFEFNGDENTTAGVDWNLYHRNLTWFGEASMSSSGGIAMNTGVLVALDKRVSMSLLYRNYQRDFQGLYSVGFAEGTNPWNERGLYTGIEIRANRYWTFNGYVDQFTFPWLRYLTDAPSHGFDWLAQVNWKPNRKVEMYARVRNQDRAKNTEDDVDGIDPLVRVEQTNYRVNATYKVSSSVSLRTRVETVDFQRGASPLQHGFLLYQDVVHRPMASPLELTLRFALFETGSYDARVYAYENDLIGVFSIPPYDGRGIRWYGMARITPLRKVDVWIRYGAWIYRDREVISSGLQEIPGNVRSDVKLQVRWQF